MARKEPVYEDDFKPWEDPDPNDDPQDEDIARKPRNVRPTSPLVPYNQLGLGRTEGVRGVDPISVAGDLVETDSSGWVKFRNWTRGIITIVKRGLQPRGSLADAK